MSNTGNDLVEIPFDRILARAHSQKAVLFQFDDMQAWIPTSQIKDCTLDFTASTGDEGGEISIPEWLAIEKGLDGYV